MFGHNSFNVTAPYKSEDNGDISDKSLEVENYLLSITPMPDFDTSEDPEIIMERHIQNQKKVNKIIKSIIGTPGGKKVEGKSLTWCYQNQYGPHIHWELKSKDSEGNYTVKYKKGKEDVSFLDEGKVFLLMSGLPKLVMGDFYSSRVTCDDLGIAKTDTDITGCMRVDAINYNPDATIGDDSCEYSTRSHPTNTNSDPVETKTQEPVVETKSETPYLSIIAFLAASGVLGNGIIHHYQITDRIKSLIAKYK